MRKSGGRKVFEATDDSRSVAWTFLYSWSH